MEVSFFSFFISFLSLCILIKMEKGWVVYLTYSEVNNFKIELEDFMKLEDTYTKCNNN